MAKTPQVGDPAPDFELPGTDGPFHLSEHRGERVVLLFYPGDNTMVCTKQFCSYRDRGGDFASLNATVLGISSQDLASHEEFVAKHGLNVPLLADVDKKVAKSYSAYSSPSSRPPAGSRLPVRRRPQGGAGRARLANRRAATTSTIGCKRPVDAMPRLRRHT
jgi:peroxiredoxin